MEVEFPEKLMFLFDPAPYKVAFGGRDGTKSWGFARALLALAAKRPLRVLCGRETQKSIADSVHKLLGDQIERMGLQSVYRVQQQTILGPRGTEFIFAGLKHNIDNIKSLEGADIVWVEEAQVVSRASWDKLLPTIRKEGAEVWVSFNPDLDTDDTYKRWVLNPPPGAKVVKIGWEDNRWLSEISRARIDFMRKTDPVAFAHIYGGECRSSVAGAIFAGEMARALEQGRIGPVPYNPARPVDTAWDLGYGDLTAIWFVQAYEGWFNFIDYLEGDGLTIADYVVQMQNRGYVYGIDWLPHDGVDAIIHRKLGGTGDRSMSIDMLLRAAGRKVRIAPKMLVNDGINAARTIFGQCRFDAEKCADGLQALRHYQWGSLNEHGVRKREPLHNWASHAADGFRTAAVAIKPARPDREQKAREFRQPARIPGEYTPFA